MQWTWKNILEMWIISVVPDILGVINGFEKLEPFSLFCNSSVSKYVEVKICSLKSKIAVCFWTQLQVYFNCSSTTNQRTRDCFRVNCLCSNNSFDQDCVYLWDIRSQTEVMFWKNEGWTHYRLNFKLSPLSINTYVWLRQWIFVNNRVRKLFSLLFFLK